MLRRSFALLKPFGVASMWAGHLGLGRPRRYGGAWVEGFHAGENRHCCALLAVSLGACTANSGPKEAGGTAVGAVAGGVIGNVIGGSAGNRLAGTVIGAAVGGLLGNRIGAALDDEDRRRAYAAQMQALESRPFRRAGRLAQSRRRTLRQCRAGSRLSGQRRHMPAIYRDYLYRRQSADRARHRVPQPRRHMDGGH